MENSFILTPQLKDDLDQCPSFIQEIFWEYPLYPKDRAKHKGLKEAKASPEEVSSVVAKRVPRSGFKMRIDNCKYVWYKVW